MDWLIRGVRMEMWDLEGEGRRSRCRSTFARYSGEVINFVDENVAFSDLPCPVGLDKIEDVVEEMDRSPGVELLGHTTPANEIFDDGSAGCKAHDPRFRSGYADGAVIDDGFDWVKSPVVIAEEIRSRWKTREEANMVFTSDAASVRIHKEVVVARESFGDDIGTMCRKVALQMISIDNGPGNDEDGVSSSEGD